ncbi:MAG: response regulator transcription factor [Deltaproteobacteria bacterium]|jgi:two-component system response regulator CpxR|nr:response regulator transcription factor [Deltaproteobacteria bacterium]
MPQVLIIDDDREFADLLAEYLLGYGFVCQVTLDGSQGLDLILKNPAAFDLVLLDLMLPGLNGLDLLREIRRREIKTPVIMLTAKGELTDKIVGLEIGADDYLSKPFEPRELLARARSVLRRSFPVKTTDRKVIVAGLRLDERALKAYQGERDLELTPVEFKILSLLIANLGAITSRDKLFSEVLGRGAGAFDRSLDIHVSRLRKKIWPQGEGLDRLKSVRGEGYIFTPDP